MAANVDVSRLATLLDSFEKGRFSAERLLALYSLAVTSADSRVLEKAASTVRQCDGKRKNLYEINLQSYLFLGFPRMLLAAENLARVWPDGRDKRPAKPPAAAEVGQWYERGGALCKRVYASSYKPLERRVNQFAPEVFRWMLLEGYGKVLSRDGLNIVTRELCIIAFLMGENYPRQLHSHIRGALNVGASSELVKSVIDEIGPCAPDGYESALTILHKLRIDSKNE
jgi:4-carboxymuconolactone decarboxylase